MRAPIVGQAHRELLHAAAARSIGRETSVAGDASDGTNVDDATAPARDHLAGHGLGDEECAAQIRVEDFIPVGPCDVGSRLADVAAGVVHQHVDAAELVNRVGDSAVDAFLLANVERDSGHATARGAELLHERIERSGRAAGDDEVRPGSGEHAGKVLSQAAAGTRDECDAAGEIK